ncbi:MAG: beta strand repeat-containing protein [Janthinobacterium lividum]
MNHLPPQPTPNRRGWLLLLGLLPATLTTYAQAPAWAGATTGGPGQTSSTSITRAVAADASGNVFVTGSFTGSLVFGSTTLTSAGSNDLFVAKYVLATNTWAWGTSGGGTGSDVGYGIAVAGSSVYVTGTLANSTANANGVLLANAGTLAGATQVNGATSTVSQDILLAKYQDNGTSAALRWTQVGGGTVNDQGQGVAVSGTSIYVTGYLTNTSADARGVVFGGNGTTAGTASQAGASATLSGDLLLAKYTDNGASATLGWTQVAGGTGGDLGSGVAVSGTSVYVAGSFVNTTANGSAVLFGGSGTTAGNVQVNGATSSSSQEILLAKYTDNGLNATYNWAQVGGGTSADLGYAVAVSGSSVYVTGILLNDRANTNAVVFGSNGTTAGTVPQYGASTANTLNLVLAKYQDNGSTGTFRWSQVGGGTSSAYGYGVAASGTSVYVTGLSGNSTSNASSVVFGGSGTAAGTNAVPGVAPNGSDDLVLAKYTDNSLSATYNWAQVGGGTLIDTGYAVALSGQSVVVGGFVNNTASFGSFTVAATAGASTNVLARVVDTTLQPLATRPATASSAPLLLYPNPARGTTHGSATLTGAEAGASVRVLDALGRVVAASVADAGGEAALAGGLAPGVYVVRVGTSAARLVVE